MKLGSPLHGFTFDSCEDLPEIDGKAYVGTHARSGAKLLFLENDDNNKSFAIGFRTPPKDDTGVFHILEHSVLCGSRRFPVKEPFVDLLKGSMQTFLNAMTFSDKTLYPVASTNEQDLFNLMDVYLDAVFHPQIYLKRAIFEQEGWHYELKADGIGQPGADAEADVAALAPGETSLTYNGVVYNEMKGALSDARSVLYDELQASLFPGTCYAFESGGTPEAIPTLTYEDYLDEHRRHYRTDNSYIILYGNLDIDRALAFLDERYLGPVADEQRQADAEREAAGLEPLRPREIGRAAGPDDHGIASLPPLSDRCGGSHDDSLSVPVPEGIQLPATAHVMHKGYPHLVKAMDTAPENACAACGYVIGDSTQRQRAMAVDILLDALLGSNEAPLKRALLDAGVAHDVQAFVSEAVAQPFAVIQVQMPAPGAAENLRDTISRLVRELLDDDLEKELVEASLSHEEFQLREFDLGMSDGVVHAMSCLSSWLYDDAAPIDYLRYERAFADLREKLAGSYFEDLCRELFCENPHTASVEISCVPGLADGTAKRLEELNAALAPEERRQIVQNEAVLRELQEAPDSPEAVATLPRLAISDIGEAPDYPRYDLDWKTPITCVRHTVPTRGIAYAYRYFDMDYLAFEDLPYAAVLALVLGKLDTARHTASELDTLVQAKLGNLSFLTEVFEHRSDTSAVKPRFTVSASALSENVVELSRIPREVLLETDFSNTAKIEDILKQQKIGMEQSFVNAGHSCAAARLKSYATEAGVVREHLGNVEFYRFICDTLEHFDDIAEELSRRLADVAARLFNDDRCTVSFAGSDADYDRFWLSGPGCDRKAQSAEPMRIPAPVVRNEAFCVPSDVCYAAAGWDRRKLDLPFSGSWLVASRVLSYDYLWNEVRVKGGAYGTGFAANRRGDMRFYSYRDPNLDRTLERFRASSDWLADFECARQDLEGFVVATTAGIDAPVKPRSLIRRQMAEFFTLTRPEERRQRRDEVISCDLDALRAHAPAIAEALGKGAVCAFGNPEILGKSKAGLELVELIG